MKNLFLICSLLMGLNVGSALAQQSETASENLKANMKKLAYFEGRWKGEAVTTERDGTKTKINQEENIQFKLDGTVLLIEGTGRNPESGKVVFNALALASYNEATQKFNFRSHVMSGQMTDAYFTVLAENKFEWGFDIPNGGKIRFDIVLDPVKKTWNEKGNYSPDGKVWYPYIELNLTKL
jgi:hypothetical protein